MNDAHQARLQARIDELTSEHREIEQVIERVLAEPLIDQLRLRRLKKRKLLLKDQVALLQRELDPDQRA